jgi:alginate O-acetyltransferase complex protein AlgI
MHFTSWTFAAFLPLVFLLHYAGRSAVWQVGVLTIASFVFYGWDAPWLTLLLAVSTTVNAEAARRLLAPDSAPSRRRRVLILALVFNLGALGLFKYGKLLGKLVLPQELWAQWGHWITDIPLPIGISFYTFQGISLVVDVYRAGSRGVVGLAFPHSPRETVAFHGRVWFFKAFFPQLIAGPIVKASELLYQIGAKRFQDIDWDSAMKRLIAGFFLKMVVADNLMEATSGLRYPLFTVLPKVNLVALLYGYSFAIFADFCGYSMIAMGLAKLFGYELPLNFNYPYLSRSITEFWRRWHLSLSSWLREYLYIPLGGNRKGEARTYVNLFVVMFLGGLWHGVAWSFAVWGTAHGILLALERLVGRHRVGGETSERWGLWALLQVAFTFTLVSSLWLLFKLTDFQHVIEYARCLVRNPMGAHPQALYAIGVFSIPVVLHHVWGASTIGRERLKARLGFNVWGRLTALVYALMLFATIVNNGAPSDFVYFQF